MIYLEMLIGGFLGVLAQSAVKIANMNSRLPNETFLSVFKTFWNVDFSKLLVSVIIVVTCVFASNEWLGAKIHGYEVAAFVKTIFCAVGYLANSVILSWLGKTEATLNDKFK